MARKKYDYKILIVNFKKQHYDLYDWLKKYCDDNGLTISHLVREIIRDFKDSKGG